MIRSTVTMDRPAARQGWTTPRRLAVLAAGLVALVAAALVAFPAWSRWARADQAVDLERLRVAQAVRGDLERNIDAEGRLVAALHPTLFAPAAGIVRLERRAGEAVRQGDVLARLESPEVVSRQLQEQSSLVSLEAELARQEAASRKADLENVQAADVLAVRLATAARANTRLHASAADGVISRQELEKAEDEVAVLKLQLDNARQAATLEKEGHAFALRALKEQVARQRAIAAEADRQVAELTVRAPFDGSIANVAVQDRDAVGARQAVLTIVDASRFEVEFELPENYARDVTAGMAADIALETGHVPGRVSAISPEIRDGQAHGTVAIEGPQPAGLRQSGRVRVRFALDRRTNVVKVPRGPFLESGGGRIAYVVNGSLATRREIAVGAVSVGEVELVQGVEPGERLIVSDISEFRDARTVLIRN